MTTVTAKELRENLSDIIDRVEGGEEVVVIRHSRPALRLVPERPQHSNTDEVLTDIKRYHAYLDTAGIQIRTDPDKSFKQLYREAIEKDPKHARYLKSPKRQKAGKVSDSSV